MADMMPQTPPKKLFKASSKTKTPLQRRGSNASIASMRSVRSHTQPAMSQSTDSLRKPAVDDIAKSTALAPLTSASDVAASDTTGETPIGLIDRDVATPTDTASRSTDVPSTFSQESIETPKTPKKTPLSFKDKIARMRKDPKKTIDNSGAKETLEKSTSSIKDAAGKSEKSPDDAPSDANNLSSPADIAKYFADQGNFEMSNFISALGAAMPDEPIQSAVDKVPDGLNIAEDGSDSGDVGSEATVTAKQGASYPSEATDDSQTADNMGRPTHIERRIDIPLPRPSKAVNNPPLPPDPETDNMTNGLGDVKDLQATDKLPNLDDLPDIPEDPPEEMLDPSVHSTSSNITPIPKISKIDSIGMAPPPDLFSLAQGLGGNTVDDVGNIVDESGKVLGHATGDLPAMVGKKVSEDGEVYDDSGDLIGYVVENFTNPPPPSEIPSDVLGGLKVDHQGNILDSNGNIIGLFHNQPGQGGPPFLRRTPNGTAKTSGESKDGNSKAQEKPKVNAHTGGSPSDIFLDVKSTNDGIQLTIRIPTTFSKPPPEP